MKRNLAIGFLASLALALGASACKKEDKKEGGDKAAEQGGDKAGAEGAAKPDMAAAAEKPASGDASAMMAHFPKDTEAVLTFSIANMRSTPMWAKYSAQMMASMADKMSEFKEACGVDPFTTIESVHVGVNTSKSEEPVVIVKGFNRAQVKACMEGTAKKEGKEVKVEDDGNFTKMTRDGKEVMLAWANDTTLLMVPEKGDKEYLQARLDGKDGLNGNAEFGAVASAANQGAAIWFAAVPVDGTELAKGIAGNPLGVAPKGLYGSLDFTDGLGVNLGARFGSAEEATGAKDKVGPMLQQFKPMLGPAGAMVDKVKLAASGNDMTINLNLSNQDLEQMQQMLGPMMGGGM
jgi:hypothetical protein